jgi:hypothetical protein
MLESDRAGAHKALRHFIDPGARLARGRAANDDLCHGQSPRKARQLLLKNGEYSWLSAIMEVCDDPCGDCLKHGRTHALIIGGSPEVRQIKKSKHTRIFENTDIITKCCQNNDVAYQEVVF